MTNIIRTRAVEHLSDAELEDIKHLYESQRGNTAAASKYNLTNPQLSHLRHVNSWAKNYLTKLTPEEPTKLCDQKCNDNKPQPLHKFGILRGQPRDTCRECERLLRRIPAKDFNPLIHTRKEQYI